MSTLQASVGEAMDDATHHRDEATSARKDLEEMAKKVGAGKGLFGDLLPRAIRCN
jgi:hypothetical protein